MRCAGPRLGKVVISTLFAFSVALTGCDSAEDRASNHLDRARALMSEGDPTRASLEYRNAIKLNDRLTAAYVELANARLALGDVAAAAAQLERAVELEPENVEALVGLATLQLAGNQIGPALALSDRALSLAPGSAPALALRATIATRSGEDALAEDLSSSALEIDPENAEARAVRAALRMRANRFDEALAEIELALGRKPFDLPMSLLKIAVLERMGEDQAASETLRALAEAHPQNQALRARLADQLLRFGDPEAAIAELRRLTDRAGAEPVARIELARFITRARGLDAGRAELTALLAETKGADGGEQDAGARLLYQSALAQLDVERGEPDRAAAELSAALDEAGAAPTPALHEARLTLARILLFQNRAAEAAAAADRVLARDPSSVPALSLRGQARIALMNYSEAIVDLRAARDQAPNDVSLLMLLASAHERAGNADLSGERLADAVRLSGFAPRPALAQAAFLARSGQIEAAERVLGQAIARWPNDARLVRALAQHHLDQRRWREADEMALRLEGLGAPEGADPLAERDAAEIRAVAAAGRGDLDDSLRILTTLEAEGRLSEPGLDALVRAYLASDRPAEARASLEAAVRDDPGRVRALVSLGWLDFSQGEVAAARARFEAAIAARPDAPEGYRALGQLHARSGDAARARDIAREGLSHAPQDLQLRLDLALAEEALGDYEAAIRIYEELVAERPGSSIIGNNYASLLAEHRDDDESLRRAFAIARRLQPAADPHLVDTYGWLLHRIGETEQALPHLERAANALPENAIVQYHLGAVLAALGQTEEAKQRLELATSLSDGPDSLAATRSRSVLERLSAVESPRSED